MKDITELKIAFSGKDVTACDEIFPVGIKTVTLAEEHITPDGGKITVIRDVTPK